MNSTAELSEFFEELSRNLVKLRESMTALPYHVDRWFTQSLIEAGVPKAVAEEYGETLWVRIKSIKELTVSASNECGSAAHVVQAGVHKSPTGRKSLVL